MGIFTVVVFVVAVAIVVSLVYGSWRAKRLPSRDLGYPTDSHEARREHLADLRTRHDVDPYR